MLEVLVCYDCGHEFEEAPAPPSMRPNDRFFWNGWTCPKCGGDGQPKEEKE